MEKYTGSTSTSIVTVQFCSLLNTSKSYEKNHSSQKNYEIVNGEHHQTFDDHQSK